MTKQTLSFVFDSEEVEFSSLVSEFTYIIGTVYVLRRAALRPQPSTRYVITWRNQYRLEEWSIKER